MRRVFAKARQLSAQQRAERLEADRLLLAAHYPRWRWRWIEAGPVAEGDLLLDNGCGPPQSMAVRILFPAGYPKDEPRVVDVSGRFAHIADRHFYENGCCCFWHQLESLWLPEDAEGLLRILDHAHVFFRRQIICDTTGKYPGPQRAHGGAGTQQALTERLGGAPLVPIFKKALLFQGECGCNQPCPCGSRRKYKRCHRNVLRDIRAGVSQAVLREAFGLPIAGPSRATRRAAQRPRPAPKVPRHQRRSPAPARPGP